MDTRTFLETVLGGEGNYCIFAARLADNRRVQKFYPSLDQALSAAKNFDAEGFDAYFALGTFDGEGARKVPNVVQMRSFFLDLDCGPTKDYASQPDALAALRKFCKATSLPRPTIVNSGRGVHAYWPLVMPVPREDWVPVAERLKALCKQFNLHADPAVTSDAARVLRVPGTRNFKGDPPLDVMVVGSAAAPIAFADFKDIIGEDIGLFTAGTPYTPKEADAMMTFLSGSFISRFKTIMLKTLDGKGCAQLGEVMLNQPSVPEPLWRAGLSVAKFCVDGSKAIHKISEKHPEYTPDATERKAEPIKGPYLCATFDEFRPNVCPQCPHWGKVKSPIVLGREVMEADESDNIVVQQPAVLSTTAPIQYTIPKYPHPYFRGKNGGVFRHDTDKDGNPSDRLVYHNDLYVIKRLRDPDAGEVLVFRLHLPKDGVREFTIPLSVIGSTDEFRKQLAAHGVAVLTIRDIMEYTMNWVNQLQYSAEAAEAQRQFGWLDNADGFVLGHQVIHKDRIEYNAPSVATSFMFPFFQPKGTLEGWKQNMEFFNRDGLELYRFTIGMGFGSVLMEFQPLHAASLHIYSKGSGRGKTTVLRAQQSIWGNPEALILSDKDTLNSKLNRIELYKNLPVAVDEMTNTKPEDLSTWAYSLSDGMQRNRLSGKANVERTRGKPWKTLATSNGNTSMIERISMYKPLPEAEMQRVLEQEAPSVQFESKEETDALSKALLQHYGHAGIVFLQYFLSNKEAALKLMGEVQRRIDTAAGLTAENRYWSVLACTTITGLILAKRAGLISWDISVVTEFIVKALIAAKERAKTMRTDVEVILTEYLAENYNNVLRISSTDDSRKSSDPAFDHLILPDATPRLALVARYEYDVKKLYLLPKPLKTWCVRQQLNYGGLLEGLKSGRTAAALKKIRLGRGTRMNLPATDVIVVDCKDFMNDETEQVIATSASLFEKQAEG